jgi:hypothetical protein
MSGRLFTVAALGLIAAVWLGWDAGNVELPPRSAAPPLPWSLPKPVHVALAPALAELKSRHPWTGLFTLNAASVTGVARRVAKPAAAGAGPVPPSWRLAGIVERSDSRFALITSGAGPAARLAYLRVGDQLPDGSRLVGIAADSATIADAKTPARQRIYRLYGEKR